MCTYLPPHTAAVLERFGAKGVGLFAGLLLFGSALPTAAHAQELVWMGGGVHAGAWRHPGHDTVTERYNDTRPWLDAPLRPHRLQLGPALRLGLLDGPLYLEAGGSLHYGQARVRSVSAEGVSGTRVWRQGRLSTDAGIGYAWRSERATFALTATGSLGVATQRTRAWADDERRPPLALTHLQLFLGVGLAAPWTLRLRDAPLGVTIRPALSYQITPSNGQAVNRALNPSTARLDSRRSLRGHAVVSGVELLFGFAASPTSD